MVADPVAEVVVRGIGGVCNILNFMGLQDFEDLGFGQIEEGSNELKALIILGGPGRSEAGEGGTAG